jgi:membrane protein implicated in regulation of membrane protease activity
MGADTIEFVYLVCFFLGLGFAVISGLLSGVFSGGAEAHVDAGGAHGGVADGSVHFSPLSPVTLATFIASFGGAGIIFKKVLGWPAAAHLPLAAVSAFAVAGVVFWLFYKMVSSTQASSTAREGEAIGLEAEITVPIPPDGVGQIAYTVAGLRQTGMAKTADGKELPAALTVKITKQIGDTYVVEKLR